MAKKKPVEVTTENYGKLLIEGLHEAVAVQQGTAEPAQVRRRKLTTRKVTVSAPGNYGARKIRRVREQFGVSQPVFACMLNVSPKTVRSWEQGERKPEGATLRLLELAEKEPAALAQAVKPRRPTRVTTKKIGKRPATKRPKKRANRK